MREISINDPVGTLPINTFLCHGDTRTGKTVFAATFPRPLMIVDVVERGYKSVKTMDPDLWFEPGVEPILLGVDQMNDMALIQPKLDAWIASGRVKTIVVDAFSYYCDFFLAALIKLQAKPDNRAAYGSLGIHLRELRKSLHERPVNVVWNCLTRHPEAEDPSGRPMIAGQQADKFAGAVDFLFHTRLEQKREAGRIIEETYEVRTRQYGKYLAGHREGVNAGNLPDPFSGTYADLITCLGHDVDAIRAALPKINASATAKVSVQAPRVAVPVQHLAPKVVVTAQASRGATKP